MFGAHFCFCFTFTIDKMSETGKMTDQDFLLFLIQKLVYL